MLALRGDRLTWTEADDLAMQPVLGIIGDYDRDARWAPYLDSLVLGAVKHGVQITSQLHEHLRRAIRRRRELRRVLRTQSKDTDAFLEDYFGHQRTALTWLSVHQKPAYLLADAPGVGKTPVAIAWAALHFQSRVLVITPNSAKYQWRRELRRWADVPSRVVTGTLDEQAAIVKQDGWVIAHWEALVNLAKVFIKQRWDAVILDEAHAIRNRKTQRARAAFLLNAPYRMAVTGHPFFNSPEELWSLLHFLYPETYTSFWRFFGMHILASPRYFGGFDVHGFRQPQLLKWELEPFTLRRTKAQVFPTLPKIVRTVREVELAPEQRGEYARLVKDVLVQLRSVDARTPNVLKIPNVLARITRLRQYLVDPGLIGSSSVSLKYPIIRELLEDVGQPMVVFTSFRQAAERLGAFLTGFRIGYLHGKMTEQASERAKAAFIKGQLDALLVVTQAGSEALNLGGYGYLAFLDLPWSTARVEQAEGRVDRPAEGTGELVPATAYYVLVRNSYERKLLTKVVNKGRVFASAFTARTLEELLR